MAGIGPIGSYINQLMNQPIVTRKRKAGATEVPAPRHSKSSSHREERSSKGARGESSRSRSHSHRRKDQAVHEKRASGEAVPPPRTALQPAEVPVEPPMHPSAASPEVSHHETTQEKTHYDVASQRFKEVIGKSLDSYADKDFAETLGDVQECLGKLAGVSARLSAGLAKRGKISVEDFEESLINSEYNLNSHKAEIAKLQKEKESMQKRYEASVQNLSADLRIRDGALENIRLDMERKDKLLSDMEDKYQKTKDELRKKLELLQKSKEDALSVSRRNEEKLKNDLAKTEEDLEVLKNFCNNQVPRLRRVGYREALEIMLKKLIFKYPEADMEYFTDLTDVPDIALEADLDFEVEVDVAAEEVAGNAAAEGTGQGDAREVQDDAISAVGAGEK